MMCALSLLAMVHLFVCLGLTWHTIRGNRQIVRLVEFPAVAIPLPSVSIVVAARNEQRHIRQAITSLLKQDYPDMQLVVVDDRSTDATPQILAELAAENAQLKVIRVEQLPEGWLGKNHALNVAAPQTSGELILFTDADVMMESSALRRAVAYLEEQGLDHVALLPQLKMPTLLLEAFGLVFAIYFAAYFRPWQARNPRSPTYVGVGAFNLVRRTAYRDVGGHGPIHMRPDDDLMLGKLLKSHGYRQELVDGTGLAEVPWYNSLAETVRGLEKNSFAGVNYRVSVTVFSSLAALILHVGPLLAVWLPLGPARWLYLAAILVILGHAAWTARHLRLSPLAALLFPVGVLLMVFILWRTMILTLLQGGIRWRDTFYPLAELKANRL